MTEALLLTTVVGSYPQPDWLIDREKLTTLPPVRVRANELWRVPEPWLEQAQDDATVLAIRDMERAGIDIITDGEIRRESYSNRFALALEGIDAEQPGEVRAQFNTATPVPRVVGKIRRRGPVELRDVLFLLQNTGHASKITLPGPFTLSRQAKNEFYADEEELVMDYAAAVNAEVRDLKAAGADVIQLDEPWLHARPEEARRLAPAGDRPGPRRHPRADRAAPLLRLCLCRPRQAERLFVPARAHGLEGRADLDRSRPAQSRSHNPRRLRRQDRDQHGRPRAGDAADRRRPHPRGTRAPAPRAADPRPGLQHEIHPARPRLPQIEGARRRCRDRPSRADRRLACRNGPIVFDLGPNDGRSVR